MSAIDSTALKLLPITTTFAAPFTAYFLLLAARVSLQRVSSDHFLGDKLPDSASTSSQSNKTKNPPPLDPLLARSRSHANFAENVPWAFILLIACELNGGNKTFLSYVMSLLLVLRILHVEKGLMVRGKFGGGGIGRPIGFFGTLMVMGVLGGYAGWLGLR